MEIIMKCLAGGKTTRLIEMCHKDNGSYMVCINRRTADVVFKRAIEIGMRIPLPITFDDLLKGNYDGKNITGLYIDNLDILIEVIARVSVKAVSLTQK